MIVGLPAVFLGLIPPVLVMPMRYYFVESTAGLAIVFVVAVGWVAAILLPGRESEERTDSEVLAEVATAGSRLPATRYSYVVPMHNYAEGIATTLERLERRLIAGSDEIVIVENGSTDESWPVLCGISLGWSADKPRLIVMRSAPGMGAAYRSSVCATSGRTVVLTADDLPFGFSDLDGFERTMNPGIIVIGSKADKDSLVHRGRSRTMLTIGFSFLRSVILKSSVSDSQGSFFVDGDWIRAFARTSRETGYLWTTELVVAAEECGLEPKTIPVVLSEDHSTHASRVRARDAVAMGFGLLRLRHRRDRYASMTSDAVPAAGVSSGSTDGDAALDA